jgi:uncharacterized YigZ family protein
MSADHYRTPAAPAEFRQKIERSEFLGIVLPVSGEEMFFEELQRIEKRHFDATHHCWAFRLWGGRTRSSDAGEPSGTAGKPILSAIEGADLFDCGVVVVRWYGGVKLGTGGLSRAYRDTTAEALRVTPLADRYVYTRFRLEGPFDILGTVYRLVAPPDVVLIAENFGESNTFDFDVRESMAEKFAGMLTERRIRYIVSS